MKMLSESGQKRMRIGKERIVLNLNFNSKRLEATKGSKIAKKRKGERLGEGGGIGKEGQGICLCVCLACR